MTENNPFGNLDLGAMLEQAQAMQAQLVQAQQELAESSVEGTAGGVTVTVDGTGELTGVTIPPHTVDTGDEEAWTDLGDLVVAAYRDAKAKAGEKAAQALGPMAGGLGGLDLGGLDLGGALGGLGGAPGADAEEPGEPRRPGGFGV